MIPNSMTMIMNRMLQKQQQLVVRRWTTTRCCSFHHYSSYDCTINNNDYNDNSQQQLRRRQQQQQRGQQPSCQQHYNQQQQQQQMRQMTTTATSRNQQQQQQQQQQAYRMMTRSSSSSSSSKITKEESSSSPLPFKLKDLDHNTNNDTTSTTIPTDSQMNNSNYNNVPIIVYESPLGDAVQRLRTVSLATGIIGTVGLPLLYMMKTGSFSMFIPFMDISSTLSTVIPDVVSTTDAIPTVKSSLQSSTAGILSLCMAFGSCTIGTTLVVHYVFSPYVYSIERIPTQNISSDNNSDNPTNDNLFLYRMKLRNLLLFPKYISYNPKIDNIVKYGNAHGYRPLCNLYIEKKNIPLYIHVEFIKSTLKSKDTNDDNDDNEYDLYKHMNSIVKPTLTASTTEEQFAQQQQQQQKNNPDDFF